MIAGLAAAGNAAHVGDAYLLGLGLTGAHLGWQARRSACVCSAPARIVASCCSTLMRVRVARLAL